MGVYNTAIITNVGQALLTAAIAGAKTVTFSKFQTSDYQYASSTDFAALTSLNGVKQTITPSAATISGNNVVVTSAVSNEEVTTQYNNYTIGIFASDGENEVLFAVSTASLPDIVNAYTVGLSTYTYRLTVAVATTENLTIDVDPGAYASAADFQDHVDSSVVSSAGVHNFRYHDGNFEGYDGANWGDVNGAETKSGNPLAFTTSSAQLSAHTTVEFAPIQDLHGYDYPWPEGGGKNLLPTLISRIKANNTEGTWSGNVYTVNSMTITILTDNDNNIVGIKANGTPSVNTVLRLNNRANLEFSLPVGSYILSGCPSGGSSNKYDMSIYRNKVSGNISEYELLGYDYGNGTEFTMVSASELSVNIGFTGGVTFSNLTFYPMIRLATETNATFAPYSNICSISGVDEADLTIWQNSIWDEEWEVGVLESTGSVNGAASNRRTTGFMPVSPSTTYYQICPNNALNGRAAYYNANKELTQYISNGVGYTFTTPNDAYYMRITFNADYGTTYNHDIGINKGKYEEISQPLPETVYGGTLDVETGELVVDHRYVSFNGTENWEWIADSKTVTLDKVLIGRYNPNSSYRLYGKCNMVGTGNDGRLNTAVAASSNTSTRLMATNIDINFPAVTPTLEGWKTFLASNPLEIAYELADNYKTTIQLTPEQVRLLNGVNTATTNGKTVKITLRNGSLAKLSDVLNANDWTNDKIKSIFSVSGTTLNITLP